VLTFVRDFTDRIRRRERAAMLVVLAAGCLGFAMALTGGRAFLERPCNPLHRPVVEETRRVARVVVEHRKIATPSRVEVAAETPAPPPPARTRVLPPPTWHASPAAPPRTLRGPPRA
jgi:hypothetical protein